MRGADGGARSREEAMGADLERRFRTASTVVPQAGREIELLHPASYDDLITEEDFVRDERLPYWADLWPSAIALSEFLATRRAAPAPGARALELGCGMGLVSSTLALLGYEVLATDYYDDALEFTRYNALRNAGAEIETRNVDWRHFPSDLGRFDLVVASDVLYERPYAALVAHALNMTLAPGGLAIVADPGRVAVAAFLDECRARSLRVDEPERIPYEAGKVRQTIALYEITRSR